MFNLFYCVDEPIREIRKCDCPKQQQQQENI